MTDTLTRLERPNDLHPLWVEELGFTGTSGPVSVMQRHSMWDVLVRLRPVYLHHGDCVGGDAAVDEICKQLKIQTICHPPDDPKKRAWTKDHFFTCPEKPYMVRNQDIVDVTHALLVLPAGFYETQRSGEWSTVRRARKKPIPRYIIWPDGRFEVEPG